MPSIRLTKENTTTRSYIEKEDDMKIEALAEMLKKMMDDEYQRGYNSGLKRALKLVKTDTGIDIERRRAETQ